ncbi:MAG TPA: helix-turn-helix transcriptional regulator [Trueperaceae bacterium]
MANLLAQRVKTLRLERGWTQDELAERAGVTLASYRRFERTGRIALERLLWIALALGSLKDFDILFQRPPAKTLDELEQREDRKKGRRRDAKT